VFSILFFLTILLFSYHHINQSIEAIIVGYHLGQLRKEEKRLIEIQNKLNVELTKKTTRKYLTHLVFPEQGFLRKLEKKETHAKF